MVSECYAQDRRVDVAFVDELNTMLEKITIDFRWI